MKKIHITAISLVILTALTTLLLRIPLPTRGYFNVGDVAVVFGGLLLGALDSRRGWIWAFGATGLGSALADILSGYAVFAPLTFIAKGMEGSLAAFAAVDNAKKRLLFLSGGGFAMLLIYFLGESCMPNIGLQGALAEIPANCIQAVGGAFGGSLAATAFKRIKHA